MTASSVRMRVSIIVAVAENGVIGREGGLPWRLSADLQRFKRLTMGHHIVMGRRTWASIGRPLPGRTSVVLSRGEPELPDGVLHARSLQEALRAAAGDDEVFVIGGAEVYRAALDRADRIYLTRVRAEVEGDVRFPPVQWSRWRVVHEELVGADERNEHPHLFQVLERVRPPDPSP